MYKLRYYSDFNDIDNNDLRIEIYKDTDEAVSAEELLLSADAVSIEYKSDDLFKSLKQSGCSVNVFTKNVLTELYTGKINEIIIKIYRNGTFFWYGYLTPNVYSSEFSSDYDLLSLEFIDTIAQLDNIKYAYIDGTQNIQSFYSIITSILDKIDKYKVINKIYLHKSLSITENQTPIYDLLNSLLIQERNFFDEEDDEDDNAETGKEVMTDLISYLGMSIVQFKDAFYILDYTALKSENYDFLVYDRAGTAPESITLTPDVRTVENIGIYKADASISLGDVYKKVKVIGNNNPVGTLIPTVFDDDNLVNQNTDVNKYDKKSVDKYIFLIAYLKAKANWITANNVYSFNSTTLQYANNPLAEITVENVDTISSGSFFQREDSYKYLDSEGAAIENAEPSSLSWTDYLTFVNNGTTMTENLNIVNGDPCLKLSTKNYSVIQGGYLIINLSYKLSTNSLSNDSIASDNADAVYYSGQYSDRSKYSGQFGTGNGYDHTNFRCFLKIGDYYYTGSEWKPYSDYTSHLTDYIKVTGQGTVNGEYKFWISNTDGTKTYITRAEYNKIYLMDNFWLVHKNSDGDKIKDEWKTLTNQVSYTYNLAESSDGVLISLPDFPLCGNVEFILYVPENLGKAQNYRTDKTEDYTKATYCHIKALTVKCANSKNYTDIFNQKEYDADTLFTNVVDDDYVTELDDLTLKVNTYTSKATSYSYVIQKGGTYTYSFADTLLGVEGEKKQEERIIQKYVDHYSTPKFIYENNLINNDLKLYTKIHEKTLDTDMVIDSITYDLSTNSATVKAIQL